MSLSHQDLCEIGARWLRRKANCGIAFAEHKVAHSSEIPDALGFRDYGRTSILLEAKVSRGDFLGDKKKPHRANPDSGIGDYRFYITPKGLINVNELPPRWGLLEVSPAGKVFVTHGPKTRLTSLSGVEEFKNRIEWSRSQLQDADGTKIKRLKSQIKYQVREAQRVEDFLFPHKNNDAERELLYGAMRMWFVASEHNVDCQQRDLFYINPMKDRRDDVESSCKNMSR